MMWIVRLALSRPYTFIVLAILILIGGPLAAMKTPTDIFPDIKIPVVAVVWTYNGLSPDDMAGRVVYPYERTLPLTVNDVEHIESQSLTGFAVVKIFFQPTVDIRTATAQVTSISQTVLKSMPAGMNPPQILNYNAATVPILQMVLTGKGMSEQQLYDLGLNTLRPVLTAVPGMAMPSPYGGRVRQVQIDLDPVALQSKGLSAADVGNALSNQQQITPAGTIKVGDFEYVVKLNDSTDTVEELNDLPIKTVNGAIVYMRDVGHVRDGSPPQQNVVRQNGRRTVLLSVLKNGSASTLSIIQGVKAMMPHALAQMPDGLNVAMLNDQSLFVKAAVSGVIREGVIAACLTSLMILLFLGSVRSTLIIAVSIPLAVLCSIMALYAMGQTLNIMTLGGLSLAVGILVDDATVTIESINWHLEQGEPVNEAILEGARQIGTPAFVSMLCICIVFVPMFTLPGVSGFLFTPMAEAVIFAMVASYFLSRTLVPTMAMYLLKPHVPHDHGHDDYVMETAHGAVPRRRSGNPFVRFQRGFERQFAKTRETYRTLLAMALTHRRVFLPSFLGLVLISFALAPFLGENFFPSVDAGAMVLHVRAPVGTTLEQTAAEFDRIENLIRSTIPADQLHTMVDNIGLPVSGTNLAYSNTGAIGPEDGDVYITLAEHHRPTAQYMKLLRQTLPKAFPSTAFAFLPADMTSQILNFGAPAPIDVAIAGPNRAASEVYADKLRARLKLIPGLVDTRLQQSSKYPQFNVDVNRSLAAELGLTEQDVTSSLTTVLSGTSQQSPAYWLNQKNGVSYPITLQTPQRDILSLSALQNIPINSAGAPGLQVLGGLATIKRTQSDAVVTHYNLISQLDIFASVQGRDLGGVAADMNKAIKDTAKDLPKGTEVVLRGQVQTMNTAFSGLGFGLVAAIVLIYLLIVVNFQSWTDPFVIITALPAALAGIVWMLFATGTPLSVPALTGAIMCMGVATANSILVVSFARERLDEIGDPVIAALEAGFVRFRPVLMTALAMIIGMVPMALGLGEGGEQNAPLGRAVIGGLLFATIATLIFVPVVFSLAHGRKAKTVDPEPVKLGEVYA